MYYSFGYINIKKRQSKLFRHAHKEDRFIKEKKTMFVTNVENREILEC